MLKLVIQISSGFIICKQRKLVPDFSVFEPMKITQNFWSNLTTKQSFKNLLVILEQDQQDYILLY